MHPLFAVDSAILSATDSVCTLQVCLTISVLIQILYMEIDKVPLMHDIFLLLKSLNQDEKPLLYSIVFGEGVVNDATSIYCALYQQ